MFLIQNKEGVDKIARTFETSTMLLSIFVVTSVLAAPQRCIRPQDMGNYSLVKTYRTCVAGLEKHCKKMDKDPVCRSIQRPMDFRLRFPESVSLIKPQERCAVQRDGSYECLLDPIRFVVKEEPKPAPGTGILPGGSPVPSPGANSLSATPQGSPGGQQEQGPPPIPPPPPPTPSN